MKSNLNQLPFSEIKGTRNQLEDVLTGKNGKLFKRRLDQLMKLPAWKFFNWEDIGPFILRPLKNSEELSLLLLTKVTTEKGYSFGNYIENENINEIIKQVINSTQFPIETNKANFIALTLNELGFEKPARISEIEKVIDSLGLALCYESDSFRIFLNDDEIKETMKVGVYENSDIGTRFIFLTKKFFKIDQKSQLMEMYFRYSTNTLVMGLRDHAYSDEDSNDLIISDKNAKLVFSFKTIYDDFS